MARVPKVLSALALVGVLAAAGCGSDNSSGGGGGGGGGGGVSSSSSSSTTSGGSTAANPGHEGPFRILSIASQTAPARCRG
jgi:hypothetical protein